MNFLSLKLKAKLAVFFSRGRRVTVRGTAKQHGVTVQPSGVHCNWAISWIACNFNCSEEFASQTAGQAELLVRPSSKLAGAIQ